MFNVAIVEKPKLRLANKKSAKEFLKAMDALARGGAYSVESYLSKFQGKKLDDCLEDEDEEFYYD